MLMSDQKSSLKPEDITELLNFRRRVLTPGPERDILYEQHPVVVDGAIVATSSVRNTYDIVVNAIVHRRPGTCIIGDFRVGKTKAIEKIVSELMQTFPDLPIGIVVAKSHDPYTEKTFYTDFLGDFKHGGANTGTTMDRRNRVRMVMEADSRRSKSDKYLLMVDEGQNWDEQQWHLLRDLTNDLDMGKIRVLTVTFAHPELLNIRDSLINKRRTDLIGRFLLNPYQFTGLSSVKELRETLGAYDDGKNYSYPINSGISYSEFFLPKAWDSGWRLANEDEFFWSALAYIASRLNKQVGQVGMNWIGGAIRCFLFSMADKDCVGFKDSLEDWISAVESCDFESSLI